jgi:hypothetical protein
LSRQIVAGFKKPDLLHRKREKLFGDSHAKDSEAFLGLVAFDGGCIRACPAAGWSAE